MRFYIQSIVKARKGFFMSFPELMSNLIRNNWDHLLHKWLKIMLAD
jgi:hypothetical protein